MSAKTLEEALIAQNEKANRGTGNLRQLRTEIQRLKHDLGNAQLVVSVVKDLKAELTAATERAEKAEAQRDRMREALEMIRDIDNDYDTKLTGHYLLKRKCKTLAKEALEEVGDE